MLERAKRMTMRKEHLMRRVRTILPDLVVP
jgi:hypothetical protein